MNLLLDTHAFLWLVMGSANLSGNARVLIEDPSNNNLISVASLWEMAIKVSLGKLTLSDPERMPVVSIDSAFDSYGITRLW